jgi:putative sugar O-methyltransferase
MNDWSKTSQSEQWERINRIHFTDEALNDLKCFKSNAVNHKLSIWDPRTNGIRYLKELLHTLCTSLNNEEWTLLDNIHERDLGTPYSVTFNGRKVCLDYLQAIYEIQFIRRNISLEAAHILEIGAGYGRTCHALLCNNTIASYSIIDLNKSLQLSKSYLSAVLPPELFIKLRFFAPEELESLVDARFSLAINIDSFAEMPKETVNTYLAFIRKCCDSLYVKNPVGKYVNPNLENRHDDNESIQLALTSGVLQDIIDIYDNEVVALQKKKFIEAYCPGKDWTLIEESWARPWSFYWQALYRHAGR